MLSGFLEWAGSLWDGSVALDGAVLAAVATGIITVITRWRDAVESRKRLRAVVVGELRALRTHYEATARDFQDAVLPYQVEAHLLMAKAEEPAAFEAATLVQAGISKKTIPKIIQLRRSIRNGNIQCDIAISQLQGSSDLPIERDKLVRRFRGLTRLTEALLEQMRQRSFDDALEFTR